MKSTNYYSCIGLNAYAKDHSLYGVITAVEFDEGWWFTIEDSWQIGATRSEMVVDLTTGQSYVRVLA